jgi:hypothetical protein
MALLLSGLPQDPQVRKQQHLERGSRYLADGKYNEAIIELKNALQIDSEVRSRAACTRPRLLRQGLVPGRSARAEPGRRW